MIRKLPSAIAAALLLIVAGCGQSDHKKNLSPWDTAMHQLASFQYDEAKATFDKIAADRPNEPIGLFSDALIMEHKLMLWNAMEGYFSIAESQSTFEPARRAEWRMIAWTGHADAAVNSASDWLTSFSGSSQAALALGQSLIDNREWERARTFIDSAAALGASPSVTSMMKAVSFVGQFEFDSAASYASSSTAVPGDPLWCRWAANYQEAAMNYDSALTLSTMAWNSADGNWEEWWYHFHRLLRLNGFQQARSLIASFAAKETTPSYIVSWMQYRYLTALGEYAAARRQAVVYKASLPQNFSTLHTEMVATHNANDQVSAEGNADVMSAMLKGKVYPKAYSDLLEFDLLYQLRLTRPSLDFLNKLEKVPEEYRHVREFEVLRLSSYYNTGQADKAKELRKQLLEDHGTDPVWLTDMADVLGAEAVKKYDEAYDWYLNALEHQRWYYPAFEHCVNLMIRTGKPKEASKLFELYPYFLDRYPPAAVLKARVMAYNEQAESGVALLPDHLRPMRMVLTDYRDVDSALVINLDFAVREKLIDVMVELSPDNPDVIALAAEFAVDNEMWDRGIELADKALGLDTALVSPAVSKAWALFQKGQKSDAFELFVKNAVANHNDSRNNMYYSRALATEGRESNRAENLARMAMFESGGDLRARINLAYVYYKFGRYDLSFGEALKASNLSPESPEAWFRLGLAQYERGQGDAIRNLQKAIKLGLRGDDLAAAKRIIGG